MSFKKSHDNYDMIKSAYSDLSKYVDKFNDIREKYNEMSTDFVLSRYMDSHEEYMRLFSEYGDVINNIKSSVIDISNGCDKSSGGIYNKLYEKIYTLDNTVCDNYKVTYERLVNLYVTDVKEFNGILTKYNEYKNDNIEMVKMLFDDYIDYNNDGTYEEVD